MTYILLSYILIKGNQKYKVKIQQSKYDKEKEKTLNYYIFSIIEIRVYL